MRPAAAPAPPASAASPSPAAGGPRSFERCVLDALPLTIYTVDLDGRITSVSGTWSRFAAENGAVPLADERAVVGTSIWDAISDRASREQIERAMQLLRHARVPMVQWEFPCNSPDEERVFLMHVSPLHDGAAAAGSEGPRDPHAVTGFAFSTVDISPSHRSREALIDSGIALSRTLDLERVYAEVGQQVRRAVRAEAFCLALADPSLLSGQPAATAPPLLVVHQFGHDETPDALAERLAGAWQEAIAAERVVLAHAARGLELTVPVVSGPPPGAAGGAAVLGAMTVLADDIESPQRLDEATRVLTTLAAQTAAAVGRARLVRRVEQKRRLEAIGEVAAGVAHELRNPLFGISSAAQLLRFRVQDDPVVEKNVGRILREVERLNRMVTSLLEYGRPAATRLEPGDPDAVWDEVLDGQRGLLEGKALLLDRARAVPPASGHPPPRVRLDAEQLAQVFLNVLVNAVDAAPEASDLALTSTALPNGGWRCRLHNGGPAIAPDVLPRVFEIFYSTKPGGTGIGLALCQRIVDEHGGTIAIESAPETGTAVTITLPPA